MSIRFNIDSPTTTTVPKAPVISFVGWVFSTERPVTIRLYVNDLLQREFAPDQNRADVSDYFKDQWTVDPICGFSCSVHCDKSTDKPTLRVRFEFDDGELKESSVEYKIKPSYRPLAFLKRFRREQMPPIALIKYVGSDPQNWRAVGEEFLGYFKRLCDLKPTDQVLDVGCGTGRMALPLSKYLERRGSYTGFDVWEEGIEWCQRNIRRPNFRFQYVDISNTFYKPKGSLGPAEFRFPYPDNSFTFTFLTSVFTHLRPEGVENYLREVHRTLKPGGRCLITYFLITDESKDCIALGRSTIPFRLSDDFYHLFDPSSPEKIIAYNEDHIRRIQVENHLPFTSVHYGSWCGRTSFLSYQDIVVAHKPMA